MRMLLLNQIYGMGVMDENELLSHISDSNNHTNFSCWKYTKLDKELLGD